MDRRSIVEHAQVNSSSRLRASAKRHQWATDETIFSTHVERSSPLIGYSLAAFNGKSNSEQLASHVNIDYSTRVSSISFTKRDTNILIY